MRMVLTLAAAATLTACASGGGSPEPELGPSSRVTTQAVQGLVGGTGIALVNNASASSSTISGSVDITWSALQSVYASLEIPLSMRDNEKKTLGNSAYRTRRRVGAVPMIRAFDCGGESGMPNAETYDITMEITSLVTPAPDGRARLQTLVQASARRPSGGNVSEVRCTSLGGLESKIAEMVEKIVAGK
jgi:hypothetical protein